MAPNSKQFSPRNDDIVIRGVHDVATDISAETRKLEGKLDALVNLQFSERNDDIVIRGAHDVVTDTFDETRKLEGKLDALVNLVTQLAANLKPASVPSVCGIRSSNDQHTSVCTSFKQSGIDEHPEAYATNTYSRPPQQRRQGTCARNDAIVIRGVHDVATDTSAETRKLEGKLNALVNLVTQLAANQKPASVARVCGIRSSNDHHTSFSAINDAIVIIGVHDVATEKSGETRKLEGKLDALVNLVNQLAASQKPASVTRQFNARNDAIAIRGIHEVATDTFAETRKPEDKLDALVNLVTQLTANQKPSSVARVYNIRSPNDHYTSVCPGVDEHPEAYAANTYSRPPQQQR
ncbi:hypothetical protein Fmac_028702 [Flemingia macrophylla]|uniref:Uncharacterized protein n=1 Tax=Flemingia macrophylla TaxID=520843 RepID=A0ABD1L8L5_9FABA